MKGPPESLAYSIVIAAIVTLLLWRRFHATLRALAGWWLHIVIDVPSHSADFYPVFVFYPLSDRAFDGVSWNLRRG